MYVHSLSWFTVLLLVATVLSQDDELCPKDLCSTPDCSCFRTKPIFSKLEDNPQFVMLTFDDAVTIANIETYRSLLKDRKNKGSGCPITSTYFVSHEYADYSLVHELWRYGNEIAVHTISHRALVEYWKNADASVWYNETVGMRQILNQFAKIPSPDIQGFRAAFLQTAGDTTFKVLSDSGFKWDSSMPSLSYAKEDPLYPYTMDYEYLHDCQIRPCPFDVYKGFWLVPLVMWFQTKGPVETYCSMLDACTPYPVTAADTFEYFKSNFERHYLSNRAPFPVFLHEAWMKHPERKKGYFQFVDWVLQKKDVFVVNVNEVLEYLSNPVRLGEYKQKNCPMVQKPNKCDKPSSCEYPIKSDDGIEMSRLMKSCIRCPRSYPSVSDPLGKGR